MPKTEADIVLISHNHHDHSNKGCLKGDPFIIEGPGEYEVKDVFVRGVFSFHDESEGSERGVNTIYTMLAEGINVCHLGDFGEKELSSEQLGEIGSVDVLFVPVGGVYTIDAKGAARVVSQIEPRIVVPMHYSVPGLKLQLGGLADFLKVMGEKQTEEVEKLSLQKKDLLKEDTKITPLSLSSKK